MDCRLEPVRDDDDLYGLVFDETTACLGGAIISGLVMRREGTL